MIPRNLKLALATPSSNLLLHSFNVYDNYVFNGSNNGDLAYPFSEIQVGRSGYVTGSGTKTYYNVNLKNLIGEKYDDYEFYDIELISVGMSHKYNYSLNLSSGNTDSTNMYNHLGVSIDGLPYVVPPRPEDNGIELFGSFLMASSGPQVITFNNQPISKKRFHRVNDANVELAVRIICLHKMREIDSTWITSANQPLPIMSFHLRITPVI